MEPTRQLQLLTRKFLDKKDAKLLYQQGPSKSRRDKLYVAEAAFHDFFDECDSLVQTVFTVVIMPHLN